MSGYTSAGVWIDSCGRPCLVLLLRFADGTHSPRLLHEDTCMGTPMEESAPPPDARHGSVDRWCARTALGPAVGDGGSDR